MLTVGATDSSDNRASFSNTGNVVDLVAPGVGITTTAKGGGYCTVSGTSFSAPIVAGVAALVLSEDPNLTGPQARTLLMQSVDDLGPAGSDAQFGAGQINAAKAVALAQQGGSNQPPAVAFTAPASGATVKATVAVAVSATDGAGISTVSLRVDGGTPCALSSAPYSFTWDTTTVANGDHTLTATATDAYGNAASAQVGVTVSNPPPPPPPDTTPPTVQIISPANGASLNSMVWVAARATDKVGIAHVDLYMDQTLVGTCTNAAATYWISTATWGKGSHVLKALAYDLAGNTAWSQPVTVVIGSPGSTTNTTPPTVQIISPANGASLNSMVWVAARATDKVAITHVDLYMDQTLVGTCTNAAATYWISTATWSKGSHFLQAEAYDVAGNYAWSQPITVTK